METTDNPELSKYQHIKEKLEEAIRNGRYGSGTRLPSERELAKEFGVSNVTVRQALALLDRNGLISKIPGRGSFVCSPGGRIDGQRVNTDAMTLALVMVEMPEERQTGFSEYPLHDSYEFSRLERQVAAHGRSLMLAHTNSRDLAAGKSPAALEQGNVAGVILSAFVDDYHVSVFREQGYPVVVSGNRPIHLPVSQVQFDYAKSAYLVTKALLELGVGPVRYCSSGFDIYYMFQLLDGYYQACKEFSAPTMVWQLKHGAADPVDLKDLLLLQNDPFALLISDEMAYALPDIYDELGWEFKDHPVAMVGGISPPNPIVAKNMSFCVSGGAEAYAVATADLMEEALAGKEPRKITLGPTLSSSMDDGKLRLAISWSRSDESE